MTRLESLVLALGERRVLELVKLGVGRREARATAAERRLCGVPR